MTFRDSLALPLLFGAFSGALGGMMGVGGGILLTPLLVHFLGHSQQQAQGTSLAFVISTAIVAVVPYVRNDSVPWPLVGVMALGAVPGVMTGVAVARRTPGRRLRLWFGLAVLAAAARLLIAPPLGVGGSPWPPISNAFLGYAMGTFAGLLGVGGGFFLVPALVLGQGLSQHTAQGVSLALIVPIGLVGAVFYARSGYSGARRLPSLLAGGALGGWFGATLAQSLQGPVLSRAFALFLVVVAVHMIAGSRRPETPAAAPPAGGLS